MSHDPKNSPPAKGEYPEGGRGLVPKLRFPEFREAGEWEYLELDPFLRGYSERVSSNTDLPIYSSTRTGLKFQKDYYDDRELANDGEYGLVPEGYFVYRHMSDDGAFKFNINKTGGKIAVSKEYPVFTTVGLNSDFLLYLLNDGEDFKAFAFAQKKGGTRTRLYLSVLRTWKALLPSYPEQQKIADCLASLDELITLEAQKLDTLKTHKKGLMQQLFPAKGETVPKLRFPEFRDAGEWEKVPLKKIFSIFQGFAFPSEASKNEGTRWLKIADVGIQQMDYSTPSFLPTEYKNEYAKFMVRTGDYVIALTRPILNKQLKIAKVDLEYDGALLNQRVGKLVTNQRTDFVYYILQNSKLISDIEKNIAGNDPPNLSAQQIENIPSRIPLGGEQQKIASCLSSLDDLITAQTQKLAALKNHKKGLMQQLFPAPDDGQE